MRAFLASLLAAALVLTAALPAAAAPAAAAPPTIAASRPAADTPSAFLVSGPRSTPTPAPAPASTPTGFPSFAPSRVQVDRQLAEALAANPKASAQAVVLARDVLDLPVPAGPWRRIPLQNGEVLAYTSVEVTHLTLQKMATTPGVYAILGNRPGQPDRRLPGGLASEPPQPLPTPPASYSWQEPALAPAAQPGPAATAESGDPQTMSLLAQGQETQQDGSGQTQSSLFLNASHGAEAAWNLGYQGSGVTVAVLDSGVDFAHPDLMGTWAVHESGPYAGWPMAFDPFSMHLYVLGIWQEPGVYGLQQYANTSATLTPSCTGGPCTAQWDGASWVLPPTSQSGVYHIGRHPGATFWVDLPPEREVYGQPGVLVVDEGAAGEYDTVYMDLNMDGDFTNDKPTTRSSPVAYGDYLDADGNIVPGGDGSADISGGLVYFVADGLHPIPGLNVLYGDDVPVQAAGSLVAIMLDSTEDHGTAVASTVVAQGRTTHPQSFLGITLAPAHGTAPVMKGIAPEARILPIANIDYNFAASTLDAYVLATRGADGQPASGDEPQVVNMSYGVSDVYNDGWDLESRIIALLNQENPFVTFVASTGNGGAGYGTVAPPAGPTIIGIGASTTFGLLEMPGTLHGATIPEQYLYGDVVAFSNRGPTATGSLAPHVVGAGAYYPGARHVNLVGNGQKAWSVWGGTSAAAPAVSGTLALVMEAFHQRHGRWPTYQESRELLMAGAEDLHHDVLVQGAGMAHGGNSVAIASGSAGFRYTPSLWVAGEGPPAGAQVLSAGESIATEIRIENPTAAAQTITLEPEHYELMDQESVTLTADATLESAPYTFFPITDRPDVVAFALKPDDIPAGTDQLVVRMAFPFSQFDPDGDYTSNNDFYLIAYNWTDLNGDGTWWEDLDGNGVVNDGEWAPAELIRFNANAASANVMEVTVQRPQERMADGLVIALSHPVRDGAVTEVDLTVDLRYYARTTWDWLRTDPQQVTVPAGASATLTATLQVPADAAVGTYEGSLRLSDGSRESLLPVVVNVAGRYDQAAQPGGLALGGRPPTGQPYDNSHLHGLFDWKWRAESGDWRLFFLDVPETAAADALVVHTRFGQPLTDVDTRIFGPAPDEPAAMAPDYFGPYTLEAVGGSRNTYAGAGVYEFHTYTGAAEEWATGRLQPGLHLVMLHNVLSAGETETPFTGEVGILRTEPDAFEFEGSRGSGELAVTSSLDLPNLSVSRYGPARPVQASSQIEAGASRVYLLQVENRGMLDVVLNWEGPADLDLYLTQMVDGNPGPAVASATSTETPETLTVSNLGPGEYALEVYSYSGDARFELEYLLMEGEALALSPADAAVAAGEELRIPVTFDRGSETQPGTYYGLVTLDLELDGGTLNLREIPVVLTVPEPPPSGGGGGSGGGSGGGGGDDEGGSGEPGAGEEPGTGGEDEGGAGEAPTEPGKAEAGDAEEGGQGAGGDGTDGDEAAGSDRPSMPTIPTGTPDADGRYRLPPGDAPVRVNTSGGPLRIATADGSLELHLPRNSFPEPVTLTVRKVTPVAPGSPNGTDAPDGAGSLDGPGAPDGAGSPEASDTPGAPDGTNGQAAEAVPVPAGGRSLASAVWEIETGGAQPTRPIKVTFRYEMPPGASPEQLAVYQLIDGRWVYFAAGQVDPQAGTITVTLPHFSTWAVLVNPVSFSDLTTGHWAYQTVSELVARGIVSGYPDGTFRPEGTVTRAEFLKLTMAAANLKPARDGAAPFQDVSPEDWYAPWVKAATELGLMGGDGHGLFRPNDPITRLEAAALLARTAEQLGIEPPSGRPDVRPLRDLELLPPWARSVVETVQALGLMSGYPDGTFGAERTLTRAEAATVTVRLIGVMRLERLQAGEKGGTAAP